ncbi:SRPBCC family protein [Bradyrhizobium oligotrophicum]|uniref:SRPBCC family protein n=1 Tax=Bradyrhizobium oligotrophicum TaxID=44255 RepID=UPI003EBC2BC7
MDSRVLFVGRVKRQAASSATSLSKSLPPVHHRSYRMTVRDDAQGQQGMNMDETLSIRRYIAAPRSAVYRALLDPRAIAKWKVPDGMTCEVHAFDAREGGSLRISLTYDVPTGTGKTTAQTDTYRGRFVKLVPNEQVVEVDEFETTDPALRGEMTITITLADADGGTELHATHAGLPRAVSPTDNETGWRMALAKLAALVEAR